MNIKPIGVVLVVAALLSVGCERKVDKVVVVPVKSGTPLVVAKNGTPVAIVVKDARGVELQEPPVVYREVYVDGKPAPVLRVEVVPERPNSGSIWVEGRWVHERNSHEDISGVTHGDQWGWHPGHWK